MGVLFAFLALGVAGAVVSRNWEMSGRMALVFVAVPYAATFLAGCSP
ncbi:MAG: hypothetical protein V2I67_09700 [Thermoanaerobaculales bacterium]|nr:hypothetical protein [Thermoanaerobaculales bacterium]